MRIAAIDVGTNTVLLTVADVSDGRLCVLAEEERFARLGQGVDATGRLAGEAMDRVVDRLAACRATAERWGAERVLVAATSASRDAANVGALVERVRRELGLDYRVVSGETEAALSFRGALARLPDAAPGEPFAVLDVGGGSTEFVSGRAGAAPARRASVDVGSVRVTERFFASRPPPPEAVVAAQAFVSERLQSVAAADHAGRPLVAVGGTAKVAAGLRPAALAGAGRPPDADRQRGADLLADDLRAWRDRLLALTPAATLALAPDLMAGRADVVAGGLLVLCAALEHIGAERVRASAGGLRHGLALAAAEGALE